MAVEYRCGVRNALEATGRQIGARTGLATARGRHCAAAPAGVQGLSKKKAPRPRLTSVKGVGGLGGAHRARILTGKTAQRCRR